MSRRPKKYQINDIRSRFQTVALDNKYQVFMEPNLNVYNAAADVGISRRFVDEDLGLYVSDAVLPGSSFADVEVSGDRHGITERKPFKRIYDDVTLTFMVDRRYKVLKYFEAWMQLINPLHGQVGGKANNQITTLNYPKDYKCTMSVVKFNKDYFRNGIGFAYYCFVRSWPLSMSSIPVSYDSGSVLKLNVTFRYERYVMENVTRGMIRSGWKGYSDSFDPWMGTYTNTSNVPTTNNDDTTVKSSNTYKDKLKKEYGDTFMGTNIDDIGEGFYNVNMEKTGEKHNWFKNLFQKPDGAGEGFYSNMGSTNEGN